MQASAIQLFVGALLTGSALSATCGAVSAANAYLLEEAVYLQSQLATGVWSGTTFTEYGSLGRFNEIGIERAESDGKNHKIDMALEPINVATVSATGKQIAPAVQAIIDQCGASHQLDNAWEWVNTAHTMKVYITAEF